MGAESAKENADISRSDDCHLHPKGHNVLEVGEQQRKEKRESEQEACMASYCTLLVFIKA